MVDKNEGLSRKQRAYNLFDQGYQLGSPQIKALGIKSKTIHSYYSKWKKERGFSSGTEVISSIIDEPPAKVEPAQEETPEEDEEEETPEEEDQEDKSKSEKKPKPSGNGHDSGTLIGQGLKITTDISVKTLALYQLAQSKAEGPLSFGDFIDMCVEDVYRGRGLDLGLIVYTPKEDKQEEVKRSA